MKTNFYNLPEWRFIGGATQKRNFVMRSEDGYEYNLADARAQISFVDYMNRRSTPVLVKTATVVVNPDSGTMSNVLVELSSADTINMVGKYIYQISIQTVTGGVAIPSQGIAYISENIDKSFVRL